MEFYFTKKIAQEIEISCCPKLLPDLLFLLGAHVDLENLYLQVFHILSPSSDSMRSICNLFDLHCFRSEFFSICILRQILICTFFDLHKFRYAHFSISTNFDLHYIRSTEFCPVFLDLKDSSPNLS